MVEVGPKRGTLVSKLCQEDPDLKCPEHDRMSLLLSDRRVWVVLLENARAVPGGVEVVAQDIRLEVPVMKGKGEYATIVGFVDASCTMVRADQPDCPINFEQWGYGAGEPFGFPGRHVGLRHAFVEAKPKILNPMEVLRQINTYRQFVRGDFLLWCPAIDSRTANVFTSQGVLVATTPVDALELMLHVVGPNKPHGERA